jgi:hypothetical protein
MGYPPAGLGLQTGSARAGGRSAGLRRFPAGAGGPQRRRTIPGASPAIAPQTPPGRKKRFVGRRLALLPIRVWPPHFTGKPGAF